MLLKLVDRFQFWLKYKKHDINFMLRPPFLYHDVSQFDISARNRLPIYGVKKRKSQPIVVLLLRFGGNATGAKTNSSPERF